MFRGAKYRRKQARGFVYTLFESLFFSPFPLICDDNTLLLFTALIIIIMLSTAMSGAIRRFDGVIPIKKLIIESCRSSGPGGQHVNKKNTKVSVSFHLTSADWLHEETKNKLSEIHKGNLNKDGFLTIRSDKTRSQTLNIADCMDKLRSYISEAEQPPAPELSLETIEKRREQLERASAERLKIKRLNGQRLRANSQANYVV